MNAAERAHAEALLGGALVGAGLEGVRFWDTLVLLFAYRGGRAVSAVGVDEVWLRLESRWVVFASAPPPSLPDREEELPEVALAAQLALLARLAGRRVTRVSLGPEHPHLLLTFDSGAALFANGRHDRYECWELGTIPSSVTVVALPGGRVSYSLPPGPEPGG